MKDIPSIEIAESLSAALRPLDPFRGLDFAGALKGALAPPVSVGSFFADVRGCMPRPSLVSALAGVDGLFRVRDFQADFLNPSLSHSERSRSLDDALDALEELAKEACKEPQIESDPPRLILPIGVSRDAKPSNDRAPQANNRGIAIEPIKLFLGYSQVDRKHRDAFLKAICMLEKHRNLDIWHDDKLGASELSSGVEARQFSLAHIIVLLISADFVDAWLRNHMWDNVEARSATVVPILVRSHFAAGDALLGSSSVLPSNGIPIASSPDPDAAWADVMRGLDAWIKRFRRDAMACFQKQL